MSGFKYSMETPAITTTPICDYASPDGNKCTREHYNDGKCIFHIESSRSSVVFEKDFNELFEKKDGEWRGFIFPDDFNLANKTIDFSINAQWSNFKNFRLSKMIFNESVEFSNSTFSGIVSFNYSTVFHKNTSFKNCSFLGKMQCSCVFKGSANFNNTAFFDNTTFRGTRHIESIGESIIEFTSSGTCEAYTPPVKETITMKTKKVLILCRDKMLKGFNLIKRRKDEVVTKCRKKLEAFKSKYENKSDRISRVFESEVHMEDVDFREPERTRFFMVDFTKAHLAGTNFRGVHFQDILWQKKQGRKLVYDELFVLRSEDRVFRKHYVPLVEDLYRNLRVTFENNKDFLTASDFYIGEMEMARLGKSFFERHLFSVNALYKYLSNYGTSPVWAFIVFLLMAIIHSVFTWIIVQDNNGAMVAQAFTFVSPFSLTQVISSYIVNSLKVLTLQREGPFLNCCGWQNVLDALFRILGPVQLALLVLSLRSKVKRH